MGQKQSRNAGDEYSGAAEDDRSTKLLDVTLHNEESNEQAQTCRSTLWELWKLTKLAVPIFIMQVSWSGMTLTDTALLGHVGTVYLNSQALQTLVTNSTGVLLTSRVLVVFGKQSFAAGKSKLVGVWTQVALFVQTLMAVAVAIIWSLAGPILRLGGASDELIWPAWYYALVLAACLPARVILYSFNQFFQSQGKLYPGVICSLMALAINLLAGLIFVLGIPFNPNPNFNPNATAEMNSTRTGGFGFEACPVVTSSTEWLQVIALLSVFVGCYHLADECWPGKGLSWAHILSRNPKGQRRICEFLKMWLPATLVRFGPVAQHSNVFAQCTRRFLQNRSVLPGSSRAVCRLRLLADDGDRHCGSAYAYLHDWPRHAGSVLTQMAPHQRRVWSLLCLTLCVPPFS